MNHHWYHHTSVYNSNLDFVMILPQKVINGKEVNTNQSINGAGNPFGALESTLVFEWIRIARSLGVRVVFCRSLFILFLFGHCVVCPSSTYGLWLPLWHLQTLLMAFCLSGFLSCAPSKNLTISIQFSKHLSGYNYTSANGNIIYISLLSPHTITSITNHIIPET